MGALDGEEQANGWMASAVCCLLSFSRSRSKVAYDPQSPSQSDVLAQERTCERTEQGPNLSHTLPLTSILWGICLFARR